MSDAASQRYDVIVIGSGAAGVSAAMPLVEAGVRVLMVDGGQMPGIKVPNGEYLEIRRRDPGQWGWMIGRDYHALRNADAVSPKSRAATLDYVFRDYAEANRVAADDCAMIGSLSVGGLTNAWGCGVARFSLQELARFPFAEAELLPSYDAVSRRVGITGEADDDLRDFFGVDAWADPPVAMDPLHERLLSSYESRRERFTGSGFRMGRARVAVLGRDRDDGRRACNRSGLCLWGCAEEALYSARYDLRRLARHANFEHAPGIVVDKLVRSGDEWRMHGQRRGDVAGQVRSARAIVLAAGTVATTRIVMRSLPGFSQARLLDLPTAAFVLWLPRFFGAARTAGPGFAQLAFHLAGDEAGDICGFTFSGHGLPAAEFIRFTPLGRDGARRVFRSLSSSTIVANCFFPGALSDMKVELKADGILHVSGGVREELAGIMKRTARRLRAVFQPLGAILLPWSFTPGVIGGAAHYAGTMPMRQTPGLGETHANGEVAGMPWVFVADGAALPELPAKSHTLSIMACADRLGRLLVPRLLAREDGLPPGTSRAGNICSTASPTGA